MWQCNRQIFNLNSLFKIQLSRDIPAKKCNFPKVSSLFYPQNPDKFHKKKTISRRNVTTDSPRERNLRSNLCFFTRRNPPSKTTGGIESSPKARWLRKPGWLRLVSSSFWTDDSTRVSPSGNASRHVEQRVCNPLNLKLLYDRWRSP